MKRQTAKKIIFTGGGSAGHVTLNLSLIPLFLEKGWQVDYIGSTMGIEKELVKKFEKVRYHSVLTGKLRRYFSWQNIWDMFKIPLGILQAMWIVLKIRPDIIFSKGGFVSFPVVVAGKINGVPVVMHESDVTPGLANKMCLPFVKKFFTTFEDTIKYVADKSKVQCVGPVLSDRFQNGSVKRGQMLCNFDAKKPVIMVIGGSLGAKSLNEAIRHNLDKLLRKYQIIHICGKGQTEEKIRKKGYARFEYVDTELKDLMKLADVVVSRAGSNSIFELLSLSKPMLLVPLPVGSSRGEQMLNAKSFQAKGWAELIADENLKDDKNFLKLLDKVFENRKTYEKKMKESDFKSTSNKELAQWIEKYAKGNKK